MPDGLNNIHLPENEALSSVSAAAGTDARPLKRQRPSPPQKPEVENMEVVAPIRDEGNASDASSDWGDWADAQMTQGGSPKRAGTSAGEGTSGELGARRIGLPAAADDEDEAWVRSMVDQGTDCSVVQGADSTAWDYVLQMAVEAGVRSESGAQLHRRDEWVRQRKTGYFLFELLF